MTFKGNANGLAQGLKEILKRNRELLSVEEISLLTSAVEELEKEKSEEVYLEVLKIIIPNILPFLMKFFTE